MKLLVSLSDKTTEFIHGMEVGIIMEKMKRGDNPVMNEGFPIRTLNSSVLIKMCEGYGYTPVFGQEHFYEWTEFMAVKNVASSN